MSESTFFETCESVAFSKPEDVMLKGIGETRIYRVDMGVAETNKAAAR